MAKETKKQREERERSEREHRFAKFRETYPARLMKVLEFVTDRSWKLVVEGDDFLITNEDGYVYTLSYVSPKGDWGLDLSLAEDEIKKILNEEEIERKRSELRKSVLDRLTTEEREALGYK